MKPEVVFALYRPHAGKDAELRRLIAQHLPVLRRLELVTDRPAILVRAQDGTYVEDLARYVDTKMKTLSGSTGTSEPLRVAVLAALNIADEFFKLEERHLAGEARMEAAARDLASALEESLREPTQTSPALP